MTLEVKKDGFTLNGKEYHFRDIQYTIHQPGVDRAIITMNEAAGHEAITVQSTHTSALMLCYARWVNNQQ